jgi:hypothetical protein
VHLEYVGGQEYVWDWPVVETDLKETQFVSKWKGFIWLKIRTTILVCFE